MGCYQTEEEEEEKWRTWEEEERIESEEFAEKQRGVGGAVPEPRLGSERSP